MQGTDRSSFGWTVCFSVMNSIRVLISKNIVVCWVLGVSALFGGCGSKEPAEEAKIEAKKEADAQLERAAELYRKRQQSGQNR
jgi:hypothetical protein